VSRQRILIVDDDQGTRHLIRATLSRGGYQTAMAKDGAHALSMLRTKRFDLLLLDVWMPRMTGLDLLERLQQRKSRPRIVIMTSDDAPETLLKAVRRQAFTYLPKPVEPQVLLEAVHDALTGPEPPPIEVVSARPEWVELVVPCTREAAERIQSVVARLDANLPTALEERIAYAFRELLLNAIEWGGQLDPSRKVRIACLRSERLLMFRIADPGKGFDIDRLPHAAIGQEIPTAHVHVREKQGLRPGGFGLLTVRGSVDELIYNEKRNEVVFVTYLDAPTRPGSS
jgi:CheY-like chemotaxis protein/anti-sigma regulatory factor (Ser/Thr protein kinase)